MTTYNIGVGQTYTTYTDANAAITFVGDDIVDGGGGIFAEKWAITESGTAGHPITFQNATINGPADYAVDIGSRSYIKLKNLILNAPTRNMWGDLAANGIELEDITSNNGLVGIWLRNKSNSSYKRITVNNAAGTDGFTTSNAASNITVEDITVTNSGTLYSIRFDNSTNVTANKLTVSDSRKNGVYFYASTGSISNIVATNGADAQIFITAATAAGVLSISNASVTGTKNSKPGVQLSANTSPTTGSINLTNVLSVDGTGTGFDIQNAKKVNLSKCTAKNNTVSGYYFDNGAIDFTINDCLAESNLWDGFSIKGNTSSNISFLRCISKSNGNTDVSSGDGYTCHDAATGVKLLFSIASKNKNTAIANIGTCGGVVYNNTFYNNHANGFKRGMIWHSVTGGTGWIYKNNIIQNTTTGDDYSGILVMIESGATIPTMDYNCYWSTNSTPFWVHNGGTSGTPADYTKYDFAGWKTYSGQDTNSIFADPKISDPENGVFILKNDSPCLDAGIWISGINDNGVYDIWNKKIYSKPNIGADQGAGLPYNLRKIIDIGQSIR